MTCSMEIELGAFVLHALEPAEADAVQMHLGGCETCRDEVGSLAFTASLLALLTTEDIERIEEADGAGHPIGAAGDARSSSRGPEIAPQTHSRRPPRRPRRILLAVAAAVLAATSVVGAERVLPHRDQLPSAAVFQAVDPHTHVSAAVTLSGRAGGTEVHLTLTGAYPTGWCSLVVHARDGRRDTAATWVADSHGAADVTGATPIPSSELTRLDVVTDTGHLLVRIPLPRPST